VYAMPSYESSIRNLPVLAADVGSLKAEIVEGKTGFLFRSEDPSDLEKAIERCFASDLYTHLSMRRQEIRDYATKGHSLGRGRPTDPEHICRSACWDRPRARQPVGEGLPFLPFRLQGGFTIPPWLRFTRPPL
jgi:hypothetical protein